MSINWNNIRPLENSLNDGFEELVCQLAKKEKIPNKLKFIRKGKPDAGVECFWILKNNDEWAWQAKFFTNSLTATQWSELDDSVNTALTKHTKLKKYYIAIPNDPPDARIKGQKSMLAKWEDRVIKWKNWANEKGLSVDFIPWWSSDLIEKLQKPENAGLTYFWFNKEEFTDDWCQEQNKLAIADLGKRYTPELNIKLDIVKVFDGLSRNMNFNNEMLKLFDKLLINWKGTIPKIENLNAEAYNISKYLSRTHELLKRVNFQGIESIPVDNFIEILAKVSQIVENVQTFYRDAEEKLHIESKAPYRSYQKYGCELKYIRDFFSSMYELDIFLKHATTKLSNSPYLLLVGEAGMGKSHLLADIVNQRNLNGQASLFFLGQHFVTDECPWSQIFKKNNITCSVDEFLGALNSKAQVNGSRIIIFIDAVNEGRGKFFWKNNIKSFLLKIKKYKWLGLVLSVRTSYAPLIFPVENISDNDIIRYTHYGFKNSEYKSSKLFFDNYGIELPSIPLLHPEFQNPLFLKLFCEGLSKAGLTKIPDGFNGISKILDFFICSINKTLSEPNKLDYPSEINVVMNAIDILIGYKLKNKSTYVPYQEAFILLNKITTKFNLKGNLLQELLSEGILTQNIFYTSKEKYEDGVYIAYERFDDHLTVNLLLQKDIDLETEFKEGGKLFYIVKDEYECYMNKGLIEALTIQIPEKTGKELYEYIPHIKDSNPIVESFIKSLLWRKTETISEKLIDYINSSVLLDWTTEELFWDTILSVSAIPEHFFNANFLHRNLMRITLPERDGWWTIYLKEHFYEDYAIQRIIDWSWNNNDKSHISDESIKLFAITLSWFHTSTNRQLRDSATKALICLLENRIHILLDLLKIFENVNDPYVYERLFAVAYGCTLRTEQKDILPKLSSFVFETIFAKDEVYPHILLRDYARGVIEYTSYLGYKLEFDIEKARPIYKSQWPEKILSMEEQEKFICKCEKAWYSISGGDFGSYIIGTNHYSTGWSGIKIGEPVIDREIVFENFKERLSKKQLVFLDALDPIITREEEEIKEANNIKIRFNVAIGRKSKKELRIAKKTFKKSLSSKLLKEYENEIEPYLNYNNKIINPAKQFDLRIAQSMIFSKVLELGWRTDLHKEFDDQIGTGRGRKTYPNERIGKKYQWIAYYEYMAKLSDNFYKLPEWGSSRNIGFEDYQGPWQPYIRDIDPTIIINRTGSFNKDKTSIFWWTKENYYNWGVNDLEWIKISKDLPSIEKLLNITDDNGEEWLVLNGYPEWVEPKPIGEDRWAKSHKRLWYLLKSYLVREEDYGTLKKSILSTGKEKCHLPEIPERYEIYNREFYWSPAYNYFIKEYYNGLEGKDIFDYNDEYIGNIIFAVNSFSWSEELDCSKKESISFLKPSKYIVDKMQLNPSNKEGDFNDFKGDLICFDPSANFDSKSYLLIKKEPFMNFLKEHKLKILWTIQGEKNIIGNGPCNRLNIGGVLWLTKNNNIKGNVKTSHDDSCLV